MTGRWAPPDTRDQVVDFVNRWNEKTETPISQFVVWLGIESSKFYRWRQNYGRVNEHNGKVPRDFWLADWEKQSIVKFAESYPLEGYRRLAFMMIDANVVAVSPSSVYRVLRDAGLLNRWNPKRSQKGTGFRQPAGPHKHWHVDVSYVNLKGTFYYLCCVLDGYSRFIVHFDLRESMTEVDIEQILERARENHPGVRPRIISDNGPQFIAKDFKSFIRLTGMTHVRTSPAYPQSNGKLERFHRTLKNECIRRRTPLSLAEAKRFVHEYVHYYNEERLHSAIEYVTPRTKLEGREQELLRDRDVKLEAARERRRQLRAASRVSV